MDPAERTCDGALGFGKNRSALLFGICLGVQTEPENGAEKGETRKMTTKLTKYGIMIIAAVLLMAMAFAGAGAATTLAGAGTQDNPYLIGTVDDLTELMNNQSYWQGNYYFSQTADIVVSDIDYVNYDIATRNASVGTSSVSFGNYTLSSSKAGAITKNIDWTLVNWQNTTSLRQIGNDSVHFSGTYLGNSHYISGLVIDSTDLKGVGLFGGVEGCTISDLTLKNSFFCGVNRVGSIVGYVSENSIFTMNNCDVLNSAIIASSANVGGVIGNGQSNTLMTLTNCKLTDSFVANCNEGIGGITGECGAEIHCDNFIAKNIVVHSNAGNGYTGGLIGQSSSSTKSTLNNCKILDSTINGNIPHTGGLMGQIYRNVTITDCEVNNCDIYGSSSTAGLVACIESRSIESVIENSKIVNSRISSKGKVGAVLGYDASVATTIVTLRNINVKDVSITSMNTGSSCGGFIGSFNGQAGVYTVENNNIENVTIIGTGSTKLSTMYGFDAESGYYVFHPYETGLNISEIQLTNGNSIKNLVIKNETCLVPTNTDMTFNGIANITGVTLGESWSYIVANAFTGTGITSAIELPKTASEGYTGVWILQNPTHDKITTLTVDNFEYAVLKTEVKVTDLVFKPSPGTMTNTNGVVYVGCSTVDFEKPEYDTEHTFNGWNLNSGDGTLLIDKDGNLQQNVYGFTDGSGCWKDTSSESLTLWANWSKSAAPTVEMPTVTINLSVGEMTEEGGTYTGYVVVNAPSDGFDNWSLEWFSLNFSTENGAIVSGFTNGTYTTGNGWSVNPNEGEKHINGFNTSGTACYLTGKDQISIVNFTINPSGATDGASINLSSTEVTLNNTNGFSYTITAAVNRTLDATAPNSVINATSTPYTMKTEDKVQNTTLFKVLNEFAQPLYDNYKMTYEIESENNLTKVVDEGKTYFIALNGTGTNNITATLNSTSDITLDVYTMPITFDKKDDLSSDAVVYSGPSEFIYTGSGFNSNVVANLSKANHNNATAAGITRTEGEQNGYARSFSYGVTYYNATSDVVDNPTEPGVYTFSVSVTENNDYSSKTLTDASYTFTITSKDLEGVWTTNNETFSAVNKSTGYMTYACPTGMFSVGTVLKDSTTAKYKYAQSGKEAYLGLNLTLTNAGTNLTAGSDYVYSEPTIRFLQVTHPTSQNDNGKSTVFYFVGHYLGDVTYDDKVSMADALLLAQRIATDSLTDENNLYGQVISGSDTPTAIINDAIGIAKYEAHLLDEHYEDI